ncbi:DUF6541 family protein [Corynebacterium sp. HMSC055D05]|uniref:DUF6541 family protein n=1 Tax=Corynebacterium sp. HMSC055D05 TaxID=1715213 RepID=UPI0008A5754C|nr:DUF6541 family protein [Corynebacterium sp. HMSC055D05]OFL92277.1 hypothetical protein HMPREF2734_09230 [Corynebacterium sp. HMSC055D05]
MTTAAAAWFAVVFFLLPGFLVAWVAGLRVPAAVTTALPVTFGVIGVSSWMWGVTSAPFNLWTFGVSMVLALAVAGGWRYAFARKARRGGDVPWRRALFPGKVEWTHWGIPFVGVVVAAWMAVTDRLSWLAQMPNGADNIVQGWDSQWHANAVRFVMETGVASSTRMGELQNFETHARLFYPSGFHAGVALFAEAAGLEPIRAVNIASTVLPAVALPLTMVSLVFAFMRSTGLTAQIAAAFAAIMAYAAPQLLWVPDYVGMWPYLFAMTLTGIVVWQFLEVPARHAGALPAAIGFLGVLCTHPAAVTVVVLGVIFAWATSLLVRPVRSRRSDTVWMALPAAAATLVFLPQVLAGSDQASEVASWAPQEKLGRGGAWGSAFRMDTRHVSQFFPDFDPTVMLWLAGAGALALVLWRGQVWPVLLYVVSLAVTANALTPFDNAWGDVLAMVGNLHYSTGHRLIMPVVMCVWAAAAIGIAVIIRLVTFAPLAARTGTGQRATVLASIAVAVIAGSAAVPQVRNHTEAGAQDAFATPRQSGRMVSADDLQVFDWLATQDAAWEGTIMGDPADGYSWMYAYNGLPSVSRHYLWPTGGIGSAHDTIFQHADFIGEDNGEVVEQALKDLNVRFFVLSPGSFWADQKPQYPMLRSFWASNGVTPVYRKGTTSVFAVNSEFSTAQLRAMRKDGQDHGSDELYELEDAGVAAW